MMLSEYLQAEDGFKFPRGFQRRTATQVRTPDRLLEDDVEPSSIQEVLQHATPALLQL